MIRDVMVWLDGGVSDEIRLAAVADIARLLQPKVVIGLFLNPLPLPGPVDGDATAELIEDAREADLIIHLPDGRTSRKSFKKGWAARLREMIARY